jgi:hypothetical protein
MYQHLRKHRSRKLVRTEEQFCSYINGIGYCCTSLSPQGETKCVRHQHPEEPPAIEALWTGWPIESPLIQPSWWVPSVTSVSVPIPSLFTITPERSVASMPVKTEEASVSIKTGKPLPTVPVAKAPSPPPKKEEEQLLELHRPAEVEPMEVTEAAPPPSPVPVHLAEPTYPRPASPPKAAPLPSMVVPGMAPPPLMPKPVSTFAGKIPDQDWFKQLTGVDESAFQPTSFTHEGVQDKYPHLPGYALELLNSKTGKKYGAGKFSTRSIEQLSSEFKETEPARDIKQCEFTFITASHTSAVDKLDVMRQQADPNNAGAMFQVASNFNAVEGMTEDNVPMSTQSFTTYYIYDRTQGPAASIGAGAAAIARVYAPHYTPAALPSMWTQSTQVELLENLRDYFTVVNGYVVLNVGEKPVGKDESGELLGKVKIAMHSGVQVTFAGREYDYFIVVNNGHTIDQVFSAAVNIKQGASGERNARFASTRDRVLLILKAAYEGAYLAALVNGNKKLFLTAIGGGVFGNQMGDILHAAIEAHAKYVVNPACKLEQVTFNLYTNEMPAAAITELTTHHIPTHVIEYGAEHKETINEY